MCVTSLVTDPITLRAATTALAQPAAHPIARFAVTQSRLNLSIDYRLVEHPVPDPQYDALAPRALAVAI
jgi:hypothetical protein